MKNKTGFFVIIIFAIFFILPFLYYSMLDKIMITVGTSMGYDKSCTYVITKKPTFQRNSVLIFDHDNEILIKRIVGVPGDTVEVTKTEVIINGVTLLSEQPVYLYNENIYKLGEDEYFMLGDNYQNSNDSKYFGPIKEEQVISGAEEYKSALDIDDPIVRFLNRVIIEEKYGMSAQDFCKKNKYGFKS